MNRAVWIDGLRGTAILLVIVWHAQTFNADVVKVGWFWDLSQQLRAVRMPVLFLLSGLLLPHSLNKPLATFTYGKFAHLAWPFGVWLSIHVMTKYGIFEPLDAKYWGDGSYLWFIFYLMIYFCVAQLFKNVPPAFMVIVCGMVAMALESQTYVLEVAIYGMFFYGGATVGRTVLTMKEGATSARLVLLATMVLLFVGVQILVPNDFPTFQILVPIPFLLTGIPLVTIAILLGVMFLGSPAFRLVQWVGQNSMVFYAPHAALMLLLIPALSKAGMHPVAIAWVAVTLSLTLCSVLAIFRRNPWIDALFVFPLQIVPPRVRSFFREIMSDPSERHERPARRAVRNESALS